MRPEMETALVRARQELAELELRKEALEAEVTSAEAWLGLTGQQTDEEKVVRQGVRLTLHAAMEQVLREHGPMKVADIAQVIAERGMYQRKDGKPAGPHQIHARVHNYPDTFVRVSPGEIGLKGA
jgi:hypothetical protein